MWISSFKGCLKNVQAAVDKMVQKTNLSALVSTGSWAEQFSEALQVSAGK